MKLSIIIPAHNEEHRLRPTVLIYTECFRERYPNEFKLIDGIRDNGAGIASRWIAGADVNPRQSLLRRIASRILNFFIVRLFFGLKVHDSQCGAKLFRKDASENILNEPIERRWAFDIDILCRLKRKQYNVIEIPTKWHHQSGSSVHFVVMSLQMLCSVLRLKWAQLSKRKKES